MAAHLAEIPTPRAKPTREEALAIAAGRKAARRARTGRIRRWMAVVSVVAFIGPFGVIYTQLAAGRDPALAGTQAVAKATPAKTSTAATSTTAASTSTGSTSTGSTSTGSAAGSDNSGSAAATPTTSQAPAAVTTSQS